MDLDQTLAALADPTRRGIVDLLANGPLSAGTLGQEFSVSAPALSRHLRVLREQGLVVAELDPHDQRSRIYRLQPEPIQQLSGWLHQLQQDWQQQLQAFADHVESTLAGDDT